MCWFAAQETLGETHYYYQCWKQLCCFIFFVKNIKWILWGIESSKEQHLFETEIFCNFINVSILAEWKCTFLSKSYSTQILTVVDTRLNILNTLFTWNTLETFKTHYLESKIVHHHKNQQTERSLIDEQVFLTNWNKTLVLASTHVKTYTVQKGERKEKKQTPIQTNFSLIRLAVGGLNLTKSKSNLSGWQPMEDSGKGKNQAKREDAGLTLDFSVTEGVRG